MNTNRLITFVGIILMVIGLIALLSVLIIGNSGEDGEAQEPSGDYFYQGEVIIELQGNSWSTPLDSHPIQGTGEAALQEYKFKQVREGEDFHYLIAGLQEDVYDIELSFVEFQHTSPGERIFDVQCNGSPLPDLTGLDVMARAGYRHAYRRATRGQGRRTVPHVVGVGRLCARQGPARNPCGSGTRVPLAG